MVALFFVDYTKSILLKCSFIRITGRYTSILKIVTLVQVRKNAAMLLENLILLMLSLLGHHINSTVTLRQLKQKQQQQKMTFKERKNQYGIMITNGALYCVQLFIS